MGADVLGALSVGHKREASEVTIWIDYEEEGVVGVTLGTRPVMEPLGIHTVA